VPLLKTLNNMWLVASLNKVLYDDKLTEEVKKSTEKLGNL